MPDLSRDVRLPAAHSGVERTKGAMQAVIGGGRPTPWAMEGPYGEMLTKRKLGNVSVFLLLLTRD